MNKLRYIKKGINGMALGKNVRAKRKALGLTQAELAEAIGKPQSVINSLEVRDSRMSAHLKNLAVALKCSVAELLGEEATTSSQMESLTDEEVIEAMESISSKLTEASRLKLIQILSSSRHS